MAHRPLATPRLAPPLIAPGSGSTRLRRVKGHGARFAVFVVFAIVRSRAERLANLRTQKPRPYVVRSREENTQRGDLVIARFFSGGLWVLEVWSREAGSWMVLTSQVTTAKP